MGSFKSLLNKPKFSVVALIIFGVIFAITGAYFILQSFASADVYVSKTGSDTIGDGTSTKPYLTIQKAASVVAAGQTVHVSVGTYNERVTVSTAHSGTTSSHVTFIADGAVVVSQGFVVDSNYTDLKGFEVTPGVTGQYNSTGQIHVTGDYNTVSDVNIHDTVSGSAVVFASGSNNNTIQNYTIDTVEGYGIQFYRGYLSDPETGAKDNKALNGTISHHKSYAAVYLDGKRNTVDGITINGGPSGANVGSLDGDGIRVNGPDMVIRNFVIHNLWEWYNVNQHTDCIQFFTGDVGNLLIENGTLGTWQPSGGYTTTKGPSQLIMAENNGSGFLKIPTNVTINNVVFMGEPQAVNADGVYVAINFNTGSPLFVDFNVNNSTFWGLRMVTSNGGRQRFHAYNNIFTKSNNFSWDDGYRFYEGDYNLNVEAPKFAARFSEGSHSKIGVAVQFTNADNSAATNYGLTANLVPLATSPAVNAGDSTHAPATDRNGNARVGTPDIGAYEYGTATSTTPVPVADTTAPTISSVASSSITSSTATIAWTTNEASDSQVEYGTTTSYGSSTTLSSGMVTTHSASLSNLTASTTYHYRVKSKDAAGNLATGSDNTLTTIAAPVAVDTTPPTVTIVKPTASSAVASTVDISASATDNTGVSKVDFYVDNTLILSQTTPGTDGNYGLGWDSKSVVNGNHTVKAIATDRASLTKEATVTVAVNNAAETISDTIAPVVSFNSPANNSVIKSSVNIAVNSTDNVAVTKLELRIDGRLVFTYYPNSVSSVNNYYWSNIKKGVHTLTATAYDAAGNSSSVQAQVKKYWFWF